MALLWHLVAGEEARTEGFGRAVQTLAMIFCGCNRLLDSQHMSRLQEALGVLTGLFGRVVLRKNVDNMVGMVCQPCNSAGRNYEVAYTCRMMREVPSCRSRQRERVWCPDCWAELSYGSTAAHHQTQHDRGQDPQWLDAPPPPEVRRTYQLSFPRIDRSVA